MDLGRQEKPIPELGSRIMSVAGKPIVALVLAAGEGTRMKSQKPKVMHEIAGRSMLGHVLASLEPLRPMRTIVVVGPNMDAVAEAVRPHTVVVQRERRGTGHAVAVAHPALADLLTQDQDFSLLVVYGDTPLLRSATLAAMAARADEGPKPPALVGLAFEAADPGPYGRVIRGPDGQVKRIVEAKDATPDEKAVTLCNAGLLLGEGRKMMDWVSRLSCDNVKAEYYLTDLCAMARSEGRGAVMTEASESEVMGVNDRIELARAEGLLQARLRREAQLAGVTLHDPASTYLAWDSRLARDVVIEPHVVLGPGVEVGEGARIRAFSHLEGAKIAAGAVVGPYARLRPGTVVEDGARVGNFVEIKNSRLGPGAKANHLTYLGDSEIGAGANIGAGTITCNYDGFNKWPTTIGEGAFIGSNSALVAPVTIGKDAIVAAGSTITQRVEDESLALARGRQANKQGRASELRAQLRAEAERRRKST